jgi:hypothetical protein
MEDVSADENKEKHLISGITVAGLMRLYCIIYRTVEIFYSGQSTKQKKRTPFQKRAELRKPIRNPDYF